MEPAFQRANTDRKVAGCFRRRQPLNVAQQDYLTMIRVEVCDRISQDAFDLLGRDLVLDETSRIGKCGKDVSEILFPSMLSH